MKVIKIMTNGRPQGINAITDKDEVTDLILDEMNKNADKRFTKRCLEAHLDKGMCIIPCTEEPFEWDENIHGEFFTD